MKKKSVAVLLMVFVLMITGCGNSNSADEQNGADSQIAENTDQTDTGETLSTEGVADYPAAIMVNNTIYLMGGTPMSEEVDDSAIIGYTESFTNTFPENNGETNFNPELGMPYAQVEGGIAVLYQNEWYLCTPHEMNLSNLYSGDYYSIMLPQGWDIDSKGNEASLIFSEEIIATITVEEDFEYGQDTESIVANWIGMRASILSEDAIETNNKETVFRKTVVRWEQSAAEEISGESPNPDETHYFYISEDNLFIDIFLRNEEYVEDIENIIKSFRR